MATAPVLAQNTSSAIGGRITAPDGKPVAGAAVTIVHIDSGSTNRVTTDAEGRYSARGLRVGGPYAITISKDGSTEKREGVFLDLAETLALDATLGGSATALGTVSVTGAVVSDKFSNNAMGAGTSISGRELNAYASVQRNLQDYARLDPRVSQTDKERGEISVAGQNSRFNSITIDGVRTNDTFGLEPNGLPTAKQPISIDAIESAQVNVSNYDVTQQGYTGANINAVTKSGTNEFKGSVYYVFRNDKLVGERFNRTTGAYADAPPFKETTKGFTLGGPIIKDKLFFFANYEELKSSRNAPEFGPIGDSLTNVAIRPEALTAAAAIAQNTYGFDAGSFTIPAGSQLLVKDTTLKLDWNINERHRANLRYNKTEQSEPIFPGISASALSLNSYWYNQGKAIETTVGQWFADWTDNFSTEFKLSRRDYESVPVNNADLPAIGLSFTNALQPGLPANTPTPRFLNFGTELSRHFNELRTKTTDAYFAGNLLLGAHELKFGADFSRNEIFNAFLQNTRGNYTFSCVNGINYTSVTLGTGGCAAATAAQVELAVLENFRRGRPSAYQVQLPGTGLTLNDAAANWTINNTGLFLQDTFAVSKNLSLMAGVRIDQISIDDRPAYNARAAAPTVAGVASTTTPGTGTRQSGGFGLDNSATLDGEQLVQPRFGFNWNLDPANKRKMQVRGGFGLFQGAAASVWLSNPFSNTGVTTRVIGCSGSFGPCPTTDGTFSADPRNQPTNLGNGSQPAANVDFVDKNMGQPSVWKLNLALDAELPWYGLIGGVEWLHTKTKQGIYYKQLNLGTVTRTGTDGRELYYNDLGYNTNCWSAAGATNNNGTGCAGSVTNRALNNSAFANVLYATKTTQGGGDSFTFSLSQQPTRDFGWTVNYTRATAKEVSPLTSSTSNSNWGGRSIFNPNEEVSANSAYLVRDRVGGAVNWSKAFYANYRTTFGLFYEGRKGKPYSWTFNNDLNGDGQGGNDLMYIPSAPGSGEVIFAGGAADEARFWDFVSSNKELSNSKGSVVKRNGSFSPFVNNFDLRLSQEIPGFGKQKGVFTFDILNVGNLLNKKWGRIDETAFQGAGGAARSFVNYKGIDSATGKYIYSTMPAIEDLTTRQVKGESQWAVQVTVRYEF